MPDTTNTKTKPPVFNIKGDVTEVTLDGMKFEVTAGTGDVKVHAKIVRAKALRSTAADASDRSITFSDDHTEARVFGAVLQAKQNAIPTVTTTGVILPVRPAAAPAAPAAKIEKPKKEKQPEVKKPKATQPRFATPLGNPLAEALSVLRPEKTNYKPGELVADGWYCVSRQSLADRLVHGIKPVTVAKFVGEINHPDLAAAMRTESGKKTVHGVHIPTKGEVQSTFNALSGLLGKDAGKLTAVWIGETPGDLSGATAVSLATQDNLLIRRNRANKNAGVLFAKL